MGAATDASSARLGSGVALVLSPRSGGGGGAAAIAGLRSSCVHRRSPAPLPSQTLPPLSCLGQQQRRSAPVRGVMMVVAALLLLLLACVGAASAADEGRWKRQGRWGEGRISSPNLRGAHGGDVGRRRAQEISDSMDAQSTTAAAEQNVQDGSFMPDSSLISQKDIYRACETAIVSEHEDSDVYWAPERLSEFAVLGRWAYERTNVSVLRHPSLSGDSDGGSFDMWVENDHPQPPTNLIHDVQALIYITTQADSGSGEAAADGGGMTGGTLTVRGQGHYVPSRGILCMLGCQEEVFGFKTEPMAVSVNKTLVEAAKEQQQEEMKEEVADAEAAVEAQEEENGGKMEAGVSDTKPVEVSPLSEQSKCRTRIILRFLPTEGQGEGKMPVSGRVESLRTPGEALFFSPIVVQQANTVNMQLQISWFNYEMVVEALFILVQAVCLLDQVLYSRRDTDAQFISQSFVAVQVVVYAFYWMRNMYYPIMYFWLIRSLFSDLGTLPRFLEFVLLVLYAALGVVVAIRRQKLAPSSHRAHHSSDAEAAATLTSLPGASSSSLGAGGGGVEFFSSEVLGQPAGSAPSAPPPAPLPPPSVMAYPTLEDERWVALALVPLYVVFGATAWWTSYFDMFLRVAAFLFLLPQIVANVLWDPPLPVLQPLTPAYVLGNTAAQALWLSYEVLRPHIMGYDDFYAFPHAWYWSSVAAMLLQLATYLLQQRMGGRFSEPLDLARGLTKREASRGRRRGLREEQIGGMGGLGIVHLEERRRECR